MSDPFLIKVRVSKADDAMRNSLRAALQHNKTYATGTTTTEREAFRRAWAVLIVEAAKKYKQPVTDEEHCHTISKIVQTLSERFSRILIGGRLRFGTSQKAFNLYLKFLWCLGSLPKPPHCPIDRIVLRTAGLAGSWTQSNCATEYMKWVNALRRYVAPTTLADWEYAQWNRNA